MEECSLRLCRTALPSLGLTRYEVRFVCYETELQPDERQPEQLEVSAIYF